MGFDCVYRMCFISCISDVHVCCVDCNAGQFGENCSLSCDCGGSSCDPVAGLCDCPAGKTGPACQQGNFNLNNQLMMLIVLDTFDMI